MDVKNLKEGHKIYGAKNKDTGDKILEFTKSVEDKKSGQCAYENISWFGGLVQARQYHTKDTHVFRWSAKKPIKLLKTNKSNEIFFNKLFDTSIHLLSAIPMNEQKLRKVLRQYKENIPNYFQHPYLKMTTKEKAWYEFQFVFGYITVHEQFQFLELLYYLLDHDITKLNMRDGNSISKKVYMKMKYYQLYPMKPKEKYNRLSFYEIDKYALVNVCRLVHHSHHSRIDGIFQMNTPSFWFPNIIIYKMNIQEYILFSPHRVLDYDGIVEE